MTQTCSVLVALIALAVWRVGPANAQSLMVGGAVEAVAHRFGGDAALNRLDGTTVGWTVLGGARVGPLLVRAEGSRQRTIHNVQTTSLVANARPVTIRSELVHDMDSVAALGGYARDLGGRVAVAAVGGVSWVTVHREFTSNAGTLLLVSPSTVPQAQTTAALVDRFAAVSVGADVFIQATRRVGLMTGVRTEPLTLEHDLSGRSVRFFAGAAWRLR